MFTINTDIYIKESNLTLISKIEEKIINREVVSEYEITSLLDYVISLTRKKLIKDYNINIKTDSLTNMCDTASLIASQLLKFLGIDTRYLDTQSIINKNVTGHNFLIAIFNHNNPYLIDLSYRQFFLEENCQPNKYKKIDNLIISSPDPGYYYEQNPEHKNIAKTIIEEGYIKLNKETAKIYCDSFYKTKRGYEDPIIKESNISGNIYLNALLKNYESSKNKK